MSRLPSPRMAIQSLAEFLLRQPAPQPVPLGPDEDPHAAIARPYGRSVRQRILDAPNLVTAEHIHRGAVGGAEKASSGTRRKWDKALEGVRRREAEGQPTMIGSEPLVDVIEADE